MHDGHQFLIFLTAALLLAVAPGPGMLYVLARTVGGGRREGLRSALGTFAGGLVHVLAAAAGLSVVLATSAFAFSVVKYAGSAYLVYLGIRMIRGARQGGEADRYEPGPAPARRSFRQGVLTEVLNPKTALFFLSFIPQFVDRGQSGIFLQFVALGAISVSLNTTADLIVVGFAAPLALKLRESVGFRRRQRVATGGALIALEVYVAASESH